KTAKPITRREKWSITTATHQQNGQRWGSAKGSQEVQKPEPIGIVVRSTCHTWLGRLAVTHRSPSRRAGSSAGAGFCGDSRTIRPTVLGARCRPARARNSAIFILPSWGQRAFSL